MKQFFLLLFFLCTFMYGAIAQSYIRGSVSDAGDQTKLESATVMLLQAQDSILISYTRADEQGKYSLIRPTAGNYLLVVSYPKYADFFERIAGGAGSIPLNVELSSVAHLIEEVVVKGRAAITIKGDTTEYDATQFKVEKNAKVEDLLKVLPGITVDASGKITAQGKTVEKMLVDGEEFFSDDPVLVSRSIRSDMVDKIQVYEKKSDKAEKTGVDDGIRTQTINVKLKEEAKRGIFGKVEAGVGSDEFYLGQGFINYFDQSLRTSAYVMGSNNGKTGLSGDESTKTGMSSESSDGSGNFNREGQPKSLNTGFLYADKSKNKTQSWRVDYQYQDLDVDIDRNVFTRNAARDTVLVTDNTSTSNTGNKKHNVGLLYEVDIDSMTNLTIRAGGNRSWDLSSSTAVANTVNQFGQRINANNRRFSNDMKTDQYNGSVLFVRKFQKKGRSLSVHYYANGSDQNGDQNLYSALSYYKKDILERDSILDQRKETKNSSFANGGSITYSEPLSKALVVSVEYGINSDRSNNNVDSYNKNLVTQRYDELDSIYSNDFLYKTFKNGLNLSINYKPSEKFNVNLSNYLENNDLSQVNNYDRSTISRDFTTYSPVMSSTYQLAKNKSLQLNYRGTNNLPTLNQIQPLRSNVDPLNEYLGNETLKPSYKHNLDLNYRSFSLLKGRVWGAYISGSRTNNALVQNMTVDSIGKTIYIWDNLHNGHNNSIYGHVMYYSLLLKKYQINHGGMLSASSGNNYNYINGVLANATYQLYSLNYGLQKSTTKGLDFDWSLQPGYIIQKNSIGMEESSKGFTFESNGQLKYFLPNKFIFRTVFNYAYQAPTSIYSHKIERFLIHPAISKKLLKDESIELTCMVNDVLNQNLGFSRDQSGTLLTERRYNTIGRYYMVKVAWEINKMLVKSK